jgi:hypothetical protein
MVGTKVPAPQRDEVASEEWVNRSKSKPVWGKGGIDQFNGIIILGSEL